MLYQDQKEFFYADGSINTERAIESGKDERSKAILHGLAWAAKLLRAPLQFASQAIRTSALA